MDEDDLIALDDRDGDDEGETDLIIVNETFGEEVLDTDPVAENELTTLDDCNGVNDGEDVDEDVFTVVDDRDGDDEGETVLITDNETFGEEVLDTEQVAEYELTPLTVIALDCIIVIVIRCGVDD